MTNYLLSLNQVARKCDVPFQRMDQLVRLGLIHPDSVTDRLFFFDSSRLSEIKEKIAELRDRPVTL
jgi:hypothetical protein